MLRYVCFTLGLLVLVALTLSATTGCQNFDLSSLLNSLGNIGSSDDTDQDGSTDENGTADEDGTTDDEDADGDGDGDGDADDDGDGDGDDDGDSIEDIQNLFDFACGTRSVITAPASVFLQMNWSMQTSTSPVDSALAKALFGTNPDQTFDLSEVDGSLVLLEVDASGTVINSYSLIDMSGDKVYTVTPASEEGFTARFVVQDGCLAQDITSSDGEEPPIDVTDEQSGDLPEVPESPCDPGQVALGHDGIVFTDDNAEHICLQVTVKDGCVDCWFENGAWHQRLTYTTVYTALGSLDNVAVADFDGDPNNPAATVDITVGDTVEHTSTTDISYETSPSPAELGYTELTFDGSTDDDGTTNGGSGLVGNATAGETDFNTMCAVCHTAATLAGSADSIVTDMGTVNAAMSAITLTDQQVADLKAFLATQ